MKRISIEIPSIIENIRIVESFIDNAKEKFNINDDIYGNIMIAVTESVNNAIQHGNKNDKDKNVFLSLEMLEKSLLFTIKDQGEGFDFDHLEDPTTQENLEKPTGRGIYVMKKLADKVEFKDKGKEIELEFNLV